MDYGLAKVADMLIKHVIFPAVNYGSPVAFMEEFVQDSDKRKEAILKIIPSHDHMVICVNVYRLLIAYYFIIVSFC